MMLANVFENKMTLYFGLKNSKLVLNGKCFEFYPGGGGVEKGTFNYENRDDDDDDYNDGYTFS